MELEVQMDPDSPSDVKDTCEDEQQQDTKMPVLTAKVSSDYANRPWLYIWYQNVPRHVAALSHHLWKRAKTSYNTPTLFGSLKECVGVRSLLLPQIMKITLNL